MYHLFINRWRIDWWKNIWYTSISDWCITELFLDWQFRHLGRDWQVPENGRNCSGWSSFQFCVVSDPMSLFTTTIVLPSCSVAISPSSNFGQIWKFPNFLMTPPRMWNRRNWRPDLQFCSDWQDFDESNRFTPCIWEINSILDVSLKLAMLHQAKVHFPSNLAVWNPKLGVN